MRLIRINYCVIPDLISLPRQLVSRGHPEYPALLSWIPTFIRLGFAGMTVELDFPLVGEMISRFATMENLLRLKARGCHPVGLDPSVLR